MTPAEDVTAEDVTAGVVAAEDGAAENVAAENVAEEVTAEARGPGSALARADAVGRHLAGGVSRAMAVPVAGWERRVFAGILVAATATLLSTRFALDSAARRLHPAGGDSHGVDRLHGGRGAVIAALDAWDRGAQSMAPLLSVGGRAIAVAHTLVELALAPVLGLALVLIIAALHERAVAASRRPGHELAGAHASLLGWSLVAVGPLLLSWVVAEVAVLRLLGAKGGAVSGLMAGVAEGAAAMRDVLAVAVLIPVVAATLWLALRVWRPWAVIPRAGTALQVAGVVVAAYLVVVTVGPVAAEARASVRWWTDRPLLGALAVVAVTWFAVTVRLLATALSVRGGTGGGDRSGRARRRVRRGGKGLELGLVATGGAVAVVGAVVQAYSGQGRGVLALGGVLGLVGVAGLPIGSALAGRPRRLLADEDDDVVRRAARLDAIVVPLSGLVPLVALGAAVARAAVPLTLARGGTSLVLAWALVPSIVGVTLYAAWPQLGSDGADATAPESRGRRRTARVAAAPPGMRTEGGETSGTVLFVGATVLFLALLVASLWTDAWAVAPWLGVHALLGVAFTAVTVVVGGLAVAVRRAPTPAAFQVLGFRHPPVISVLALWAVAGLLVGASTGDHDVRLVRSGNERASTQPLTAAYAQWLGRYTVIDPPAPPPTRPEGAPAPPAGAEASPSRPAVPLVLVSAGGDGAAASAFTASVLDCLFLGQSGLPSCALPENATWSKVFAASGTAGGAVGIASVAAQGAASERAYGWVPDRLAADLAAPGLAWQMFAEVPDALLHAGPGRDRAEVQERAWERRFGADDDPSNPARSPLLGAPRAEWSGPLLLFGAVDRADGCEVNTSRVDGLPDSSRRLIGGRCDQRRLGMAPPGDLAGSRDLTDYLCADEDVALSTAAFLSNREGSTPPGVLGTPGARRPDAPACDGLPAGAALEVGAPADDQDRSGAGTLLELWQRLEPLVEAQNRTGDVCVVPVFVQVEGGDGARGAGGWADAAADEFRPPLDGIKVVAGTQPVTERYARFSPTDSPAGPEAAPWSLTPSDAADLQHQVIDAPANQAALETVRRWMGADLRCEVVPPSSGGGAGGQSGL